MIEKALDSILPGTENGRSLVRFIISQLSRLKRFDTGNINIHNRAIRIFAYTVTELAQKYIIPIPNFELKKIEKPKDIETDILSFTKDVYQKMNEKKIFKGFIHVKVEKDDFGPLNIQLPFYENPLEKMKALEQREDLLIKRLERIKKIEQEFNESKDPKYISMIVCLNLLNEMKVKYQHKVELPPNTIIPVSNIKKEYIKHLNYEMNRRFKNRSIIEPPSFLKEILNIQKVDIEGFLKEKPITMNISYKEFERLVNDNGPLNNLDVVQKLFSKIQNSDKIGTLYDWLVNGYKKYKDITPLMKNIIEYCKKPKNRIFLEEFCLRFPSQGSDFVLDFLQQFRETIRYEKLNPKIETSKEDEIIKKGAYEFLKIAIQDQFGQSLEFQPPIKDSKIIQEKYKEFISKFDIEKQFEIPKINMTPSDHYYITQQKRYSMFK